MKIYGDEDSSLLRTYFQKFGMIYGHNDVLKGPQKTVHSVSTGFLWGTTEKTKTFEPKLYLHISNTGWSSFTGILREYFLPWRWKAAYLDQEDGACLKRVLVCTSADEGTLSKRLHSLLGRSLFVTNLIKNNHYDEIFGQEFFRLPRSGTGKQEITHPLGKWVGSHFSLSTVQLYHINRIRGVYSRVKYNLLKRFSGQWEEVAIKAGNIVENVLIKRNDRAAIARAGLIN